MKGVRYKEQTISHWAQFYLADFKNVEKTFYGDYKKNYLHHNSL